LFRPSTLNDALLLNTSLTEADLAGSPMAVNGMKLLRYAEQHAGIPLTKTYRNFHRKCVEWAAEEFQWPGFEPKELYAVNKVLNEQDFLPLSILHEVFLDARLIRHRDGKAILTRAGSKMLGQYGELQAKIADWLLFSPMGADHPANELFWDLRHMLRLIDNRLSDWVTLEEFAEWAIPLDLFPESRPLSPNFEAYLFIAINLVRPLTWLGLLEQAKGDLPAMNIKDRMLRKTPLFDQSVRVLLPSGETSGGEGTLRTVH
jgi:hypothetical protein